MVNKNLFNSEVNNAIIILRKKVIYLIFFSFLRLEKLLPQQLRNGIGMQLKMLLMTRLENFLSHRKIL
jgi:hypothetical protein